MDCLNRLDLGIWRIEIYFEIHSIYFGCGDGFLMAKMDKKLHRPAFDRCSLNEKNSSKMDFLLLLDENFQFFLLWIHQFVDFVAEIPHRNRVFGVGILVRADRTVFHHAVFSLVSFREIGHALLDVFGMRPTAEIIEVFAHLLL